MRFLLFFAALISVPLFLATIAMLAVLPYMAPDLKVLESAKAHPGWVNISVPDPS